jgi:uncharacterized repeat protein (TIGR01451 family)
VAKRTIVATALAAALLAPATSVAATTRPAASTTLPKSDLEITVAASPGFTSGSSATYTLTIKNFGPQSAVGPITVTDTLAAGLAFTSATGTGWSCSAVGQVVTCTTPGPMTKNVPTTITIVASIMSTVATSVTNVARVAYPGNDDSDLTNNVATTTSAVTVRSVSTTPDGDATTRLPSNGTTYSQAFTITNTGSVSDSYSLVANAAPGGIVTIVSVAGVAGSTATTASIAAGATTNVTVVYSVATGAATGSAATLTLTATSVTTPSSTNAGDLTITVARAGITMSKQLFRDDRVTPVGAAAVNVGEYVQYLVVVASSGGADATTVNVTDPIPAAVVYDSVTPDAAGWTIVTAAGTLTASLTGTLAPGSSRFFWLRVRVK